MQVYRTKIDFWEQNLTVEDMELQHTKKIYPPKVKVTIRSTASNSQVLLTITFSNIREEDNLDVEIEHPFSMFLTDCSILY